MIRIVTDTLTGFPLETMRARGIPVIPQIVIFGETSYRDDSEIDTATFLQKLKASQVNPKTAAPAPHFYAPIFEEAAKNGDTVLVIAPSAKVSGTVRSIETAKTDFPEADIRILDTQTLACNQGTLTLIADDMRKAGKTADEIEACVNEMAPRGHIYFVLDTIDAADEAEALRAELSARTGLQDIPIYLLPPAIVVHAGPKALGVGFFA
jgi:DegV family protein with EDD domain